MDAVKVMSWLNNHVEESNTLAVMRTRSIVMWLIKGIGGTRATASNQTAALSFL